MPFAFNGNVLIAATAVSMFLASSNRQAPGTSSRVHVARTDARGVERAHAFGLVVEQGGELLRSK